jgi:predicted dehydrogenase
MVDVHPQWVRTREIVRSGEIGQLRAMHCVFSYTNRDPRNIRNIPDMGGGALMDIGCYPIHISRWIFDEEPRRVAALLERDPEFGTDRLSSAILEYRAGQAVFTCSTQMAPFQRIIFFGTAGRVEVEIPVNAPPDRETRIWVGNGDMREERFPICDQYTLQGDAFSRAVLEKRQPPVTLENAYANMAVIGALFRSAATGRWESVG